MLENPLREIIVFFFWLIFLIHVLRIIMCHCCEYWMQTVTKSLNRITICHLLIQVSCFFLTLTFNLVQNVNNQNLNPRISYFWDFWKLKTDNFTLVWFWFVAYCWNVVLCPIQTYRFCCIISSFIKSIILGNN